MTPSLADEFAAIAAEITISKAMDAPLPKSVKLRSAMLFCAVTEDIANALEVRALMGGSLQPADGKPDRLSSAACTACTPAPGASR